MSEDYGWMLPVILVLVLGLTLSNASDDETGTRETAQVVRTTEPRPLDEPLATFTKMMPIFVGIGMAGTAGTIAVRLIRKTTETRRRKEADR